MFPKEFAKILSRSHVDSSQSLIKHYIVITLSMYLETVHICWETERMHHVQLCDEYDEEQHFHPFHHLFTLEQSVQDPEGRSQGQLLLGGQGRRRLQGQREDDHHQVPEDDRRQDLRGDRRRGRSVLNQL